MGSGRLDMRSTAQRWLGMLVLLNTYIQISSAQDVMPMDHVPSHLPRILDSEDDPDLEPHEQGLWDPLAGKLNMKLDSGEMDLVDGETSAVGAIAGQPVIKGTVGTVR